MGELSLIKILFLGFLLLLPIILNLWSIWHIFQVEFKTGTEKTGWVIVAVFLPVIGGLVYCLWGRKRGVKSV